MGNNVDVVYVLGSGSAWNDNELKYSLRSLQKHLSGINKIFIVGRLPEFINPETVVFIPYEDKHEFKQTRIALKIFEACKNETLSDDFLFMNDDHFLLKDYVAKDFPYYWEEGLLETAVKRSEQSLYRRSLFNTFEALTSNLRNVKNFDIHCPIVYNKQRFKEMFCKFDWINLPNSFVIKSMYCNLYNISGQQVKDLKLNKQYTYYAIENFVKNEAFFSISDMALNDSLRRFLEYTYPYKSDFER